MVRHCGGEVGLRDGRGARGGERAVDKNANDEVIGTTKITKIIVTSITFLNQSVDLSPQFSRHDMTGVYGYSQRFPTSLEYIT